jgi:hypothetical protein
MQNKNIPNIFALDEINDFLNNPLVKTNKDNLSDTQKVVKFSIPLTQDLKANLEDKLTIQLPQINMLPMRWIKGDTLPHIDKGEKHFNHTYLIYLTNSIGNLVVADQQYSITAGDAHIFSEGLEHATINTGDSERLMIGPMSETGFRVGGTAYSIYYFNNLTDASNNTDSIGYSIDNYTLDTVNTISSWIIFTNDYGTDPTPNGGPYNTGQLLVASGSYRVYAYIPPPRFSMRSLFTNNAQVYYKSHSLSTGGGGSGVKNSRLKQRRT